MLLRFINMTLIISLFLFNTVFAQKFDVEYRPNVKVMIDKKLISLQNSNGQTTYPIMYKGISYIPLKTIADVIGKNIILDKNANIIKLSGNLEPQFKIAAEQIESSKNVLAEFKPDIKIILDENKSDFINQNDSSTYPLDFNGDIYLPSKVAGSIMNKEIGWNRENATIYMGERDDIFTSSVNEGLDTSFFEYKINSAVSLSSIGIIFPQSENKFVIVNMTITNLLPETLPMYYDDFQIKWGESAAEISSPIYNIILGNKIKDKFNLEAGESVTGNLIFEVPRDIEDLKLEYIEVFDNLLVGNTYQIKFKII